MNALLRWGKFNLVGAMGMGLQLTALALFERRAGSHYLIATAAAIELPLLHNFAWHVQITWRDRKSRSTRLGQLLRFHLSNGLVSMAGNLSLMRLLVREVHMPVLGADGIAILCCSVVNFRLGDRWVFAAAAQGRAISRPSGPLPYIAD